MTLEDLKNNHDSAITDLKLQRELRYEYERALNESDYIKTSLQDSRVSLLACLFNEIPFCEIQEIATQHNIITGERLTFWDNTFNVLGIVPVAGVTGNVLSTGKDLHRIDKINDVRKIDNTLDALSDGGDVRKLLTDTEPLKLPGPEERLMRGGGTNPINNSLSSHTKLQIKPETIFSWGRSGEKVKNLIGPPNSVIKGSGDKRIFITDERGRVILDVTPERTKPVIPNQGFGDKRPPTEQELEYIKMIYD